MHRTHTIFTLLCSALLLASGRAAASDPVGVYALVDKVIFEPTDDAPERIQIWGAFALAKKGARSNNEYHPPVRGFLYCSLPSSKENVARTEWKDLKKLAGKEETVGIGARWGIIEEGLRVRKASEKAEKPDAYPLGFGLQKLRRDTQYAPIRDLLSLAAPVRPADNDEVKPGRVELTIRNAVDSKRRTHRYLFEIERAAGDKGPAEKETSGPVDAGEKETRWSPRMEAKAGERYIWRVWAVEDDWRGPAAAAEFRTKA